MNYLDFKNIFVVFPMGTGGNHLANLLSLHPDIEPRFDAPPQHEYIDVMKYRYLTYLSEIKTDEGYGNTTVHYSNLENLHSDTWKIHSSSIFSSEKICVFCTHSDEYVFSNIDGILDGLEDRLLILFTYPKSGSYAYHRHTNGHWFRPEQTPYTSTEFIKAVNDHGRMAALHEYRKPDADTIITIDTDEFVSEHGFDYIKSTIKDQIGLEIPEFGRDLHSLWFNAVKLIKAHS